MSSVQPRERGSGFLQLAPALVGLVGVLVGAAATSGVTDLVAHNRGKAGEQGAERVVLAEVQWNNHLLKRPHRLTDAACVGQEPQVQEPAGCGLILGSPDPWGQRRYMRTKTVAIY
jgi:hypothetical protein